MENEMRKSKIHYIKAPKEREIGSKAMINEMMSVNFTELMEKHESTDPGSIVYLKKDNIN